jgi:hypothetical protein
MNARDTNCRGKTNLFWKIRCVVAWTFYIAGAAGASIYFLYILYLAFFHLGPHQFAAQYPAPTDGFLFVGCPILIFFFFALGGRLFSWTSFGRPLPRFHDLESCSD